MQIVSGRADCPFVDGMKEEMVESSPTSWCKGYAYLYGYAYGYGYQVRV